jgi:hypothetical protein
MDLLISMPFLSGSPRHEPQILGRFLPPIPDGIARAWLSEHGDPSAWVLDPFGSSPSFAVEAAATGRRVLVAANNPVTRFLIELAASPPSEEDFKAALAELGAARSGDERLEQHILSLYETGCATCGRAVSADAFIWDGGSGAITRRIYTCVNCGDTGERDATAADVERAAGFAAGDAKHRSRALTRVAPPGDPDRSHAEEALHVYLPRAVYALNTLINRLDQLTLSPARRRALHALLLHACDLATTLWSYGPERDRPRSLQLPTVFRENNVWRAMEALLLRPAAGIARNEGGLPLTTWPELPPESGGLCLFEGALRDLVRKVPGISFGAALGVFPRPNSAFWTLSALWAGWLWGRESAATFKSVLRRKRYDWQWHAEALGAALNSLAEMLAPDTPLLSLLAEAEPPFVSAALAAGADADFALDGVAMRADEDPLQLAWRAARHGAPHATGFDRTIVKTAVEGLLAVRAEPIPYLHAYTAGSAALAATNALPLTDEVNNQAAAAVQEALADAVFVRYRAKAGSESGFWGLANPGEEPVPLSDRVEIAVVRYLSTNTSCRQEVLHDELSRQFPGMLTPSLALVRAVVDSYAVEDAGAWSRRDEDNPSARRVEIEEMLDLIKGLGQRLEYHVIRQEGNLVVWEDALETAAAFFVQASAVLERALRINTYPPEKTVLVIPGGRAGLMAYKLRRDPYLAERTRDWRFVKFRHLRQLSETALLSRETWDEQLSMDPIEQASGQMVLF